MPTALIVGLGIGELYRSVYQSLGWDITTVDKIKPADATDVSSVTGTYDIAHVCTPNFTHEEVARQCAAKSSIVFVEKPGVANSEAWQNLVSDFANTRITMVKNNQFRSNVNELKALAVNADTVRLNWLQHNRVPHPGHWFTNKQLAYGGVSRDLLPHMLSWFQVLEPNYRAYSRPVHLSKQNYTLDLVQNTEYGTVNPNGVYNVDDWAEVTYHGPTVFEIQTCWKYPGGDRVNIEFIKNEQIFHTEQLGLCPESAYREMVDRSYKNIYNTEYWNMQYQYDLWIHKQIESL